MDDTDAAELANPSITSVDLGSAKRAKAAAKLLIRRLADPSASVKQVVIEPTLSVRESSVVPGRIPSPARALEARTIEVTVMTTAAPVVDRIRRRCQDPQAPQAPQPWRTGRRRRPGRVAARPSRAHPGRAVQRLPAGAGHPPRLHGCPCRAQPPGQLQRRRQLREARRQHALLELVRHRPDLGVQRDHPAVPRLARPRAAPQPRTFGCAGSPAPSRSCRGRCRR